jgi:hypothetical protein
MSTRHAQITGVLLVLLAAAPLATAQTPRRFALVIGNSEYTREPVPTAVEDALLMKGSLEGIGFEVDYHENLDRQGFLQVVQEFESTLRRGDIALFYFAGHGINVDGNNYLVPLRARIFSDTDATFEAIPLNRITESFSFSDVSTGLAFVEASYNNSYPTAGRSIRAGMTPVSAGTSTLVAFAAGAGQFAIRPEGRSSYFTRSLSEYIAVPGVEIHQLLTLVRRDVSRATASRQLPFSSSSLLTRFVFQEGENRLGILNQPFFNVRIDGDEYPVEVYANGNYLGVTPLLRALPPGDYEFEFAHERFETQVVNFSAQTGEYVLLEPELREVEPLRTSFELDQRLASIRAGDVAPPAVRRRRNWGVGLLATGLTNLVISTVVLPAAYAPYANQYYVAESFDGSRWAREAAKVFRPAMMISGGVGLALTGFATYLLLTPPRDRSGPEVPTPQPLTEGGE